MEISDKLAHSSTEEELLLPKYDLLKNKLKKKCIVNCLVISVVFYCLFTPINSLIVIATSINDDMTLAIVVFSFSSSVGSYLSPIIIPLIGARTSLGTCLVSFMAFVIMVHFPHKYTLLPTAILAGINTGVAFVIQMIYNTNISITYSRISSKTTESVLEYCYGIFFLFLAMAIFTGNLLTSVVVDDFASHITPVPKSSTIQHCGAAFCPEFSENITVITPPTPQELRTLVIAWFVLVATGLFLVTFALDKINTFSAMPTISLKDKKVLIFKEFLSPLKVIAQPEMVLLTPIIVYMGMTKGVLTSDYDEAYTTCVLGVSFVGYTMMTYGIANAIGSLIAGCLGPIVSRLGIITIVTCMYIGCQIFLVNWNMNNPEKSIFFLVPIIFGFCDGALKTQVSSLIGILFTPKHQEAPPAVMYTLIVIGMASVFAYNSTFCIRTKTHISIATLLFSYVFYLIFYCRTRKSIGKLRIESEK